MSRVFVINSYSAMESVSCVQNIAFSSYEMAEEYLLKFCDFHTEITCHEDGILYVTDQYKHKDMEDYYVIKQLNIMN